MKYTLFILLFFSIHASAQKPMYVYRIIEKTNVGFDDQEEKFNFDSIPIPLYSLNAKLIFTTDQLLIVDGDTIFINLGPGSKTDEDSTSSIWEWKEADQNGDSCYVYLYKFLDQEYDKVLIIYQDELAGNLYMASHLKLGTIPTATAISTDSKKRSGKK